MDTITIHSNSVCRKFWGGDISPKVLIIGGDVTSISSSAFKYCASLREVTIGTSVTSIGNYAFKDCSGLTSIQLGPSITSIGKSVFDGCASLTSINLPNNITKIKESTFDGCTSLTSIALPTWLTEIDGWAFNNCSSLTNVDLPITLTSIGMAAFQGCSSLKNITLPNSLTNIDSWAFNNCSTLTKVELPTSITSISSYTFYGCSSLKSIYIPHTITSIGDDAFGGCTSVDTININSNSVCEKFWTDADMTPRFLIIGDSVTSLVEWAFYDCSSLINVKIGSSITYTGTATFAHCTSLKSISITSPVTSLEYATFYNCSSLTNVTIPNTVTKIGNSAFSTCTSLKNITIPEGVTSIGRNAFYDCTSLTTITMPQSLNSIGDFAFYDCTSLKNITIPDSIVAIGRYTFYGCTSLKDVTMPNTITSIGFAAFLNCTSLTNILIPTSTNYIGSYAFGKCTSLSYIDIPSLVATIDSSAFRSCSSLDTVIYRTNIPSVIDSSVFMGIHSSATLLVPCEAIDTFSVMDNWNKFHSIHSYDTINESLTITICNNEKYDFNGKTLSSAGLYTDTIINDRGCNSILTLTLEVSPYSATNTIIDTVIGNDETYSFDEKILSCSGIYTDTLQTINGCDSIITLNLVVNALPDTSISVTICDNQTYQFGDRLLSEEGTYIDTLVMEDGYDAIVLLELNFHPTYENAAIEHLMHLGDTVDFLGNKLTKAGTYNYTLQSINGCDSVVSLKLFTIERDTVTLIHIDTLILNDTINIIDTLFLTNYDTITLHDTIVDTLTQIVHDTIIPCPKVYTYIYATINAGETYTGHGFTAKDPGTYSLTTQPEDGCDSTIFLYLTVLSGTEDIQTSQIVMYPNPTTDKVHLSFANIPNAEITIRDISGNIVRRRTMLPNETNIVLDVNDLISGTYTITIHDDKTKITKKLIKQ